ncbi:MAG: nuclear transport factor 2 family protein [Gammaproteobacteria bacterium]|nr:nuclear transport factor 2 family protein [Gammaproteobacteria bacterium]MBU2059628.1 nuclear transport factor 2 family protein [Gammaproteobacteria bacterium]MBU2175720.1 nuclear transport factor 2 family protein [Gammaproteobacteria bacterium]MBU2248100.1 nuclear transport factor 2 family protein [Gammaproteobacteria bacterium]MBU2345852.1 nuclear transport factor 2 family protein [Gammaproteobacteria bacterium]
MNEHQTAERLDNFLSFYNNLSQNNLNSLHHLYAANVEFIDPVHHMLGLEQLQQYFSHAYARLSSCHFVATSKIANESQGCLSWIMTFTHDAIGNGKAISVHGCSVVHWNSEGKIAYHRDYYDLNEMVLEHIPLLGWVTKKIKQKMAKDA